MSNDESDVQTGETNRWLVGIIGAVGAMAIVITVGFQAQVDQRQDESLRQVAELNAEVHRRQDAQPERSEERAERITDTLNTAVQALKVLEAREEGRRK